MRKKSIAPSVSRAGKKPSKFPRKKAATSHGEKSSDHFKTKKPEPAGSRSAFTGKSKTSPEPGGKKRTAPRSTNKRFSANSAPIKKSPRKRSSAGPKKLSVNRSDSGLQRLQKILAAAGLGSRRTCEELITMGRVEVDRKVMTRLGTQVDPNRCEIRVDGEVLRRPKSAYLALYKPKGYLCTNRDEQGRKRAVDLIPDSFGRVFPIGRLDMNSEGLLLLTNDGELSNRLTHPKYGVPKVYRVQVAGILDRKTVEQLHAGIYLAEGFARAENIVIKGVHKMSTILEMTLREGINREIRRLFARVNHKVITLIRFSIGPIKLGKMLPGEYRVLTPREVSSLYKATEFPE